MKKQKEFKRICNSITNYFLMSADSINLKLKSKRKLTPKISRLIRKEQENSEKIKELCNKHQMANSR
jgi:hypothetical protein